MDTPTLSRPSDPSPPPAHLGPLGIARLLVLLQGGVLLAGAIEAAVVASSMGGATMPNVVLTAAGGLLTLLVAVGLTRGSRWARRWTIAAEAGVLALVGVDLVVGAFLGGPELLPMTLVLRVGVPIAVIGILRRADVRVRFARPARVGAEAADPVVAGAGAVAVGSVA